MRAEPHPDRQAILSEVWRLVNARGGTAAQRDRYDAGFNDGIGAALDVIEGLGGCDPATPSRNPEHLQAAE